MKDKFYNNIKNYLVNNENYKIIKDYSKNRSDLLTYYNVGKELVLAGKHYGDRILKKYSEKLTSELNKKYNETDLKRMRQFYYIIEKGVAMPHQLSWSHVIALLPIKNINAIKYYINASIKNCISYRQLRIMIKNKEYERLPKETREKLINDGEIEIKDLVPNPILIKSKNNEDIITEKALHTLILEDIESFMNELGNSFSFVGSEYKIKIGDRNYYIDFLLFNIKYNAYVVVELKVVEFKVEFISQIWKYMSYIDKNVKEINNNNTIGIIICKYENKFVIEYFSCDRITIRKYQIYC